MRTLIRHAAVGSLVAIGALLLTACRYGGSGSTAPSTAASAAGGAGALTVTVTNTSAGDALSGADGMTLYILTNDTDGTSTCTAGCATTWPPLLGDGSQVTIGDGDIVGTFGTSTRDDGALQVTYDGQPLYYYSGDSAAGDSNGDGASGVWFITSPGDGASASEPAASQDSQASPSPTPYDRPGY